MTTSETSSSGDARYRLSILSFTSTFDHNRHDARRHPRTLHRATHRSVEQETFHRMCASGLGDAANVSHSGRHIDRRSTVSRTGGKPRMLTIRFAGRCPGETSQRRSTRSDFFEEFAATCQSTPPGSPHGLRHLRLRHRSTADRLVDPRLSILAQIHYLQPQELGIDRE